jgi:hypothetical protein
LAWLDHSGQSGRLRIAAQGPNPPCDYRPPHILPAIIGRHIPGFASLELLRRNVGSEVEFVTILQFESIDAVKAFAGDDYEAAVVSPQARALLSRFDERSSHYELRTTGHSLQD